MSNAVEWILKQGSKFKRRIEYTVSLGRPIDLTGFQARLQVRPTSDSSIIYFNLTTTASIDGTGLTMTPLSGSVTLPISSGSIGLTISAYSSSIVNFDTAYFDFEIYSGSGVSEYVDRLFDGRMKMQKNITR